MYLQFHTGLLHTVWLIVMTNLAVDHDEFDSVLLAQALPMIINHLTSNQEDR